MNSFRKKNVEFTFPFFGILRKNTQNLWDKFYVKIFNQNEKGIEILPELACGGERGTFLP